MNNFRENRESVDLGGKMKERVKSAPEKLRD
jgi:hypothetical protein